MFDYLEQQKVQYSHDLRNHFDILSLSKPDRLKHYGLHFAKYVGRMVRDGVGGETATRTLVDAMLVSLSCANTLHLDLSAAAPLNGDNRSFFEQFADASGVLADACEKIDHLEPFNEMANRSCTKLSLLVARELESRGSPLETLLSERRAQLAARQFFNRT